VHWNFFFTLTAVSILSTATVGEGRGQITVKWSGAVALILVLLYQSALSLLGWSDFILHSPRRSFVEQNREGLVSVVGYFALHLIGLTVGSYIHTTQREATVSATTEQPTQQHRWHSHSHLTSRCVCAALCFAVLLLVGSGPMATLAALYGQHNATQHNTTQHNTTQHNTTQSIN
jgi:hypothetical protein